MQEEDIKKYLEEILPKIQRSCREVEIWVILGREVAQGRKRTTT